MESDLFSIFGIKSRIREKRSQRRTITTLTTNSEESFYNNNNNNKDDHQILFIDSNNSQDQLNRIIVKNQNDSESEILSVLYFVLVCTVCIAFVALVIMVYCCLKRRNSYKSTPNDLASLTTTLTATNITSHHHHHHYSSTLTTTTTSGIITSSSSSNSPIVQQHQQSGSDRFISSSNHHHQISSSESQSGTTTTAPTFLFSDPTPAAHYRPPLAITTAPAAVAVASQSSVQQQPPTSVINNSSSLMTTSTSTNTNSQSSTSSSSSSTSTSNYSTSSFCSSSSTTSMKTPLKELCITIPTAKPSLNEAKPQLSIEAKLKTKSLYERRGSNNSLTLTLTPIKKKLSISSPSKECSTLEYLSKASRTLSIPELIEISKDNNNLYNEFYLIPFNHPEVIVNGSSMKNRYKTIVPNESSRVKLPMRDNDPLTTYINANYINGYKGEPRAYIASQGPMSNTIGDFWRMVWSERVSSVVMITKLIERNKSKCELYIPEQCMQAVCYDSDIWVMVNHVTSYADYEVRQLTVRAGNEAPRVLYHYWYTAWPDHNLPEQPDSLIKLIKQVESVNAHAPSVAVQSKYDENNMLVDVVDVVMMDESSSSADSTAVQTSEASSSRGPILVHCSAGVGRTGCFLALSLGIRQLDAESMVDVVQIVCSLRKDRGGMIQTLEQYEFIYQVLAYYCIYYKKQHQQIQQQQQQQAQSQAHNHHHHHANNQSRHHLVSPASSTTTTSSQSPLNQSTIEAPPSSSSSSSSSASSSSSNAFSTTSTFSFNHSSISVSIPAAIPPTPSPHAPNEPNAFVFP